MVRPVHRNWIIDHKVWVVRNDKVQDRAQVVCWFQAMLLEIIVFEK